MMPLHLSLPLASVRSVSPWRRQLLLSVAAVGLSAALPGCSILSKPEPVDTYRLPNSLTGAARPFATRQASVHGALRINRPVAAGLLAGQQIVVLPGQSQVSVYQGARWSEPIPVMVRNRLLDAFLLDGQVAALSNDERALRSDYELDSDLRAFQTEYQAGVPEVVMVLDTRLVRSEDMRIVANRRFELRQPVPGKEVPTVVQAFGEAADALSTQVVPWALSQMRVQPLRAAVP